MWQYTSILILLKSPVHPLPLEIKLVIPMGKTELILFGLFNGSESPNFTISARTRFFWGGGIKYPLKFGETSLFEKKAPVNIC